MLSAANTSVSIDQDNTVSAFERCPGRTHIDARRICTVLAHHRQIGFELRQRILQFELADPLRRLVLVLAFSNRRPAIFCAARSNTIVATRSALGRVDQHAPAYCATRRLFVGTSMRDFHQHDARRQAQACSRCSQPDKPTPLRRAGRVLYGFIFAHWAIPAISSALTLSFVWVAILCA